MYLGVREGIDMDWLRVSPMDSGRKGILGRRIHAGKAWIRERR